MVAIKSFYFSNPVPPTVAENGYKAMAWFVSQTVKEFSSVDIKPVQIVVRTFSAVVWFAQCQP